MPRIYELPAQTGAEPGLMRGGPVQRRRPQFQQPQGSADPIQMLTNQEYMELNNVTREFDINVSVLDQQILEPDKYKSEYTKLQRQAMNQRIAVQAKHQAVAQQIKNMRKLVEDGILTPEQMQSTMLTMAGVPVEHVRRAFAQQKQETPRVQLNNATALMKKEIAFRGNFEDRRKNWFGKGLSYVDPALGIKRSASEAEQKEYDDSALRIEQLARRRAELFAELTPLERAAEAGTAAVDRYGMGREPSLFGRHWAAGPAMKEPQPTPEELMKKRTKKAYEQGKRLGYWK